MTSLTIPPSRLGGLCGDLAAGMRQQMVFWGHDVVHGRGNLLVRQGFEKSPSAGLKGTSCYGLNWQDGRIELHGACAGWFPADGGAGFLFIRPLGKCHVWKGGNAPVPGDWPASGLDATNFPRLLALARPFLAWWIDSERWIDDLLGPSYRDACHRQLRHLPKGRPWLPPAAAIQWVASLSRDPSSTPRAKRFAGSPGDSPGSGAASPHQK